MYPSEGWKILERSSAHSTNRKKGSLSALVHRLISCPTRKQSGIKSCISQKRSHFWKAFPGQRCHQHKPRANARSGRSCTSSSQFTAWSTLIAALTRSRNKSWLKTKSRETSETKAHPTGLQQNLLFIYFFSFQRGRKQQTTKSPETLRLLSTYHKSTEIPGQVCLGDVKSQA